MLDLLVVNWQDRENPQSGGAEHHLHEVFGRLAAAGDRVTLLCSGFEGAPARTQLDGIEVHRVGGRYTFGLHARRYYARHLLGAGRRFDVIVEDLNKVPLAISRWPGVRAAAADVRAPGGVGSASPSGGSGLARVPGGAVGHSLASGTPLVLLVHHLFGRTAFREASWPVAATTWLLEQRVPRLYRGVDTIAVSPSTRDDLIERGLPAGQIEVIPNGVDLAHFRPGPGFGAGPQPSLGTGRYDTPTLLYLGRLKRYKGVDLVLEAVAQLRARGVAVRFVIAGTGDDQPRLEARARELELGEAVEFAGFVDEARKLELLQRSWVHVLTSPKEGWGLTVIEAAACGTPTVASDAPGLRDSVRDGVTGRLVPHADVTALGEALAALLQDDEARQRMADACIAHAQQFSWQTTAERVRSVLARRVDSGQPRP